MKNLFSKKLCLTVISLSIMVLVQSTAAAPPALPNPVLIFLGQEHYQVSGKQFIRYSFDVFNKDEYPAEMFSAAPELPPCGKNAKASRTWVDLYDQNGKRLYGFCSLAKPGDLSHIWFGLEENELPPSWIYIELTDRKTNTKYKSNLAETTL